MTPDEIQAVVQTSRQHLSAGAPDLAIGELQKVLDEEPGNLPSLKLMGIACAMKGDNTRAVASLEAALAQDAADAQLRYNLALLYEKQHRYVESYECLNAALRVKPDYALARQALERVQPLAQERLDLEAQEAEELALQEAREAQAKARREAAERAAQMALDDPAPLVDAALTHDDPTVRRCVVRVFAQLPRPRALECYAAALRDEDELVRRSAAKALARYPRADAVPILLTALKDREYSVRNTAAQGFGVLMRIDSAGAAEAIPSLQALLADENGDVQCAAVEALVRLGDPEALSNLRQMLQANRISAEDAAKVLAEAADRSVMDRTADWLNDSNEAVRETAAALRERSPDSEEAVHALTDRLKNAPIVADREKAARALGKTVSREAVAPLIEALQDRGSAVRVEAARSLAALGDTTAVDALYPLLSDSYLGARAVGVEALSVLGWRPARLSEWVSSTFADLSEGERRALLKEFAAVAIASETKTDA
jgi:HEAT repeat protein